MLISGDVINVLCSPEIYFVVLYTDIVKYCQSRVAWVCIHVALVGMTVPATVLSPLTEVQHPRTEKAICLRATWTTNTLQLRLATNSHPLDTE